MKLKPNQICPLHRRRNCCGRKVKTDRPLTRFPGQNFVCFEPGVRQIPDEHHPRGYRELRSRSAMHRLLMKKIIEQDGICGICHQPMQDIAEVVPDHILPKGNGGAWHDDHPDNIQAAHSLCNLEKGSKRIV